MPPGRRAGSSTLTVREVRINIDPQKAAEILRSPSGPVYRRMVVVSDKVKQRAIDLAPEQTGRLKSEIVKRLSVEGDRIVAHVISPTPYALFVHEGTKPHVIEPKSAKVLAFQPHGSFGVVFARRVNHPGTQRQPYLTDALREVISEEF